MITKEGYVKLREVAVPAEHATDSGQEAPALKVEDFRVLSPLVRAYEFKPGFHYLVVVDGKDFPYGLAYALLKNIGNMHPELEICVIATLKPKGIEVREPCPPSPSEPPEIKP